MQNDEKQFSVFERAVVVAIILFVSVLAIQSVLRSVKASEERTLNNAAVEYAAVKNMYVDQRQAVLPGAASRDATGPAKIHNAPVH
jgi:type II secretory pathway pseudopilin PulG